MKARLILWRTLDGRTMIGGVVLDDLCPDGKERIVQCELEITAPQTFVVTSAEKLAGRDMDDLMVTCLGVDLPNKLWRRE